MEQPDFVQLYYANELQTPRKYLALVDGAWQSLTVLAEQYPSLEEFAETVNVLKPALANDWQTICYIWLVPRSEEIATVFDEVVTFFTRHNILVPSSPEDLADKLNRWLTDNYIPTLNLDIERLELLQADNKKMDKLASCYYTEPTLDRIVITLDVEESVEGIDVLNRSTVSTDVPLIVDVNPDGKITVKVFEQDFNKKINFNIDRVEEKGSLFLITGGNRIITFFYYNTHPHVTFSVKSSENIDEILQLIIRTTHLTFGNIRSEELVSTFNIFGEEKDAYEYPLELYPMLVSLLGNGLLNRYLYTDEVRKLFMDRTRFSLIYRRPFDASFPKILLEISPQQSIAEQPHTIIDKNGDRFILKDTGILYLSVTITTPNQEMRDSLIPYLTKLFNIWRKYQKQTFAGIEEWTGVEIGHLVSEKQMITTGEKRRIFMLRELASDLIMPGYAKSCFGINQQPLIIPADQVAEWTDEKFEFKGETYNREVVGIPLEKPKYFFGCDSEEYPFIGVKCNVGEHKSKYPVIPCCYSENQNRAGKTLWRYLNGDTDLCRSKSESKGNIIIRTMKILPYNREGYLPPIISFYLTNIGMQEPLRYGTIISPNSLLHCILYAIKDERYLQLTDEKEMEEYAKNVRRSISGKYLNGFRQEMYDMQVKDIKSALDDADSYLDPRIYFHGLECYFNVRIFLFEINNENGGLMLPRGKWYTVYSQRTDLPSVLILTHHGTTVNTAIKYPQSELIIDGKTNDTLYPEYTQALVNTLNNIQVNSLLRIYPKNVHHTVGSTFDPTIFFKGIGKITHQYIDGVGKGVGVSLEVEGGSVDIITPPFAPLALTVRTKHKSTPLTVAQAVLSLLPPPDWYFQTESVQGLGYHISNRTQSLYILLDELPTPLNIPKSVAPLFPKVSTIEDEMEQLRATKKGVLFLLQTVLYLYTIYVSDNHLPFDEVSVEKFWNDYITIVDNCDYQWQSLPRRFPQGETVQECIQEYATTVPGLIHEGKILLNDRVSPKLQSTVNKWFADRRNEKFQLPEYYDNYFTSEDDFKVKPLQRVFLSWDNYQSWLKYQQITHNLIRTILDQSDNQLEQPYVYYNSDTDKYWIIQNITGGNWKRAINVAVTWQQSKVNLGFKCAEYTGVLPAVNIHKITEGNQLQIDVNSNVEGAINLYEYKKGFFSALLPLYV